MTQVMTGGMAIVEALIANGTDTLFGIPGAQMYAFFDALALRADRVKVVGARHEQTCGYMAFGYARSTGRPGVFSVVPGPGVLNASAALVTALGCNSPVLCVTGQVPAAYIGKGRGHLHELPDQLGTLRSITKWAARIERIEDAPAVVGEAFQQMLSGRPGPVVIEMAWDLMLNSAAVSPLPAAVPFPPPVVDAAQIDAAASVIANAKRPMILVGSGAQDASEAVREFAEEIAAPVGAMRGGRGVIPGDHELCVTNHEAYRLWPDTDVLIGIGSRLELPYMRWSGILNFVERPVAPPVLVRVDISAHEMTQLAPHFPVVADAKDGVTALIEAVRKLRTQNRMTSALVKSEIARIKHKASREVEKVQPQMSYLKIIRDVVPRDGIFVGELSQVGFASYFGYPVYEPRTYISEGFQGTLGAGFPTALGVKVAHPDKVVVSVTGDGGFMFAVQELATARQENIALVTILFNNKSFGNVMRDQRVGFEGRTIGSKLVNPDFLALSAAFGVTAFSVSSPAELGPVLHDAIHCGQPVLIVVDVECGTEVSPWEFINPPLKPAAS